MTKRKRADWEATKMETPEWIEMGWATSGRVPVTVRISSPEDCREAALWFLKLQDRFK